MMTKIVVAVLVVVIVTVTCSNHTTKKTTLPSVFNISSVSASSGKEKYSTAQLYVSTSASRGPLHHLYNDSEREQHMM